MAVWTKGYAPHPRLPFDAGSALQSTHLLLDLAEKESSSLLDALRKSHLRYNPDDAMYDGPPPPPGWISS